MISEGTTTSADHPSVEHINTMVEVTREREHRRGNVMALIAYLDWAVLAH